MGNSSQSGGPIKTKDSEDGSGKNLRASWGVTGMQGWRPTMEDAHFCNPGLDGEGWRETACFGVLDGHGGNQVADFVAKHFCEEIVKLPPAAAGDAMTESFHTMDRMLRTTDGMSELRKFTKASSGLGRVSPEHIGCTAVVTCFRGNDMIVAWAGDSRAVLCRNGQAMGMTEDHKPQNPEEEGRIQRAGGYVRRIDYDGLTQYRVNGDLNVSRAIGDLEYKRNSSLPPSGQMICSTPDVRVIAHEPGDEFMLMCCDGIWDRVSNQEAVDFVRERLPAVLGRGGKLSKIMEELCDRCVSPDLMSTNGFGGDNMTAMLIVFEGAGATIGSPSEFAASGATSASAGGKHVGKDAFCKMGTVADLDMGKPKKGGGSLSCCAWCSQG